jgi:predicted transcriptional regulator
MGGANKTRIVYYCNLNFHTVNPYLELLLKNSLVEMIEGNVPRYKTTTMGLEALRHFRELEALIPDLSVSAGGEQAFS